ncbi:MAG TPA: nuclease-related domain-containing protein [Solirubrobacteraceae bacterium]|nr:nuclease-related domain-containing protein [Solirubrobacteraceae bacterium]
MRRRIHLRGHRSTPPHSDEEAGRRTEALLRRLPEREWTVLGDLDPRHAVDHVLVGPSGVFAIASHLPPGAGGRVRDGVLWLRHDHDPRADRPQGAINRHVLDGARALHREIRSRTGRGPEVHPVVVLWCEFPQRVAESSRIAFVHGRDLPAWVAHRPLELDEPGRAEIVRALRAMPAHDRARGSRHLPRPHIPSTARPRRAA